MENLIRVSDLLVLDATVRSNKSTYNVNDVVLSQNGKITSIIISNKGLLSFKKVVQPKDIDDITKNGIVIKSFSPFRRRDIKNMRYSSARLLNKRLESDKGEYLGRLSDFYISISKLSVMAVEVSRSFFEDLFRGRNIIPGNIITDRSDAVIITENQMENTLHNMKGIINAIDDGIPEE